MTVSTSLPHFYKKNQFPAFTFDTRGRFPGHSMLFFIFQLSTLKGSVRPDWIYMRVVPLDRPWKGHKPLWVFDFLISHLTILKRLQSSELLHAKMNPTSCLFDHITVCIESCLPIDWRIGCSILFWIAGCWNSFLTSRNPKNNWCLYVYLEHGSPEKITVWAHANRDPNK